MSATEGPLRFYRARDDYGEFSNFSPHPVTVDDERWPTVEHFFQAAKFSDPELRARIRGAPTPHDAARMGRSFPGLRPDWEVVKEDVMYRALRAKFTQHRRVARLLLSTGDRELVEHTANDRYWADAGDGTGLNRLGALLMKLREELREAG